MQVVLLRVGIDTGSGGISGPLFSDGSFEYIPIPDRFRGKGADERTYGNTCGRTGSKLVEYFPEPRRSAVFGQSLHFDPEFETFTYGDPTPPKASLRGLSEGSLLVFYAGLKGWDFDCSSGLYIIGYFEVIHAGLATSFSQSQLWQLFRKNFHVMHREVFDHQKDRLVLIKGSKESRLLKKAVPISSIGTDKSGRPLHRLSEKMQKIFGDFDGRTGIQRSPPRWVAPEFTQHATQFIRALR
jgi:putative DNA base modification enzyme with NMAD domain